MISIPIGYSTSVDAAYYNRKIELAKDELQVCKRLTEALYEWLTLAARTDIEEASNIINTPASTFAPSIEYLSQACNRRDQIQQQLETMNEQIENLQRQLGGSKAEGMVGVFKASLIMPLEMQLKDAEDLVSSIQKQMESAQGSK